jgi:hypothetical protein
VSKESSSERSLHKGEAYEILMEYASEHQTELEEGLNSTTIQPIERNFLKLFGLLP